MLTHGSCDQSRSHALTRCALRHVKFNFEQRWVQKAKQATPCIHNNLNDLPRSPTTLEIPSCYWNTIHRRNPSSIFSPSQSAMSAVTTPNDSPVQAPIQPLHNPSQAAHVVVPQAPLGNATNGIGSQAPGMGAKALLAKKLAKSQ